MVIVIWRQIQKIYPDKWDDLEEIEKKFNEIEKKLGFPANKKRYRHLIGTQDINTLIIEYQWESMAKMEKMITKAVLDPEYQKLQAESLLIIQSSQWELYTPWPLVPP